MPKRKRDKCDESEYEYLSKKLKKLQKRISHCRRRSYTSSDSDNYMPRKQQESNLCTSVENNIPGCSYWSDAYHSDVSEVVEQANLEALPRAAPTPEANAITPLDVTTGVAPHSSTPPPAPFTPPSSPAIVTSPAFIPTAVTLSQVPVEEISVTEQISELDSSLMEILGKDPSCIEEYGDNIQKDLAIRLNHIATVGLSKEIRKELKDKYLVPANCKLIKGPTLNPEIRASLIESQAKRDKGIEYKQELTSCALASLGAAITLLLSSDSKNPELLKLLIDTARTLGDIQHTDSISRRFFILSTVKKDLKDQLEKTKIDEMLFGSNLQEVLKSAKIINKSGADIRAASILKSTVQRPGKAANKHLNFRPPPVSRRAPPGGTRGARATYSAPIPRQTTTATQHSATKPSSRQPPPRYRR
ncbi:unnamed protein product [Chilo suppressalis]|uniref:Uncharacterized protein n=1 Tax=Chilo suppressalis TaxID=168631 RepID=A0ABN8B1E1_CHISP|nr:hypothetical protein evm_011832 [Chilo suppressalis]CAH0399219.1 unnamed protein product [Chilo suppressalis]